MRFIKQGLFQNNRRSRSTCVGLLLLVLTLVGCECEISIKTNSLPAGTVGQQYDFRFQESTEHCSGECAWRIVGGNLPPGLSLSDGGRLNGSPTLAGTYSFTVEVVSGDEDDALDSDSASVGLALTIN